MISKSQKCNLKDVIFILNFMSAVILMRYYDFLCQMKNGNGKIK